LSLPRQAQQKTDAQVQIRDKTVRNRQRIAGFRVYGGICLWPLFIAVSVHLALLSVLFFVRFSRATTAEQNRTVAAARLNRPNESDRDLVLLPKPKTKRTFFQKDKRAVVSAKKPTEIIRAAAGGSRSQSSQQRKQKDFIYFPLDFHPRRQAERFRRICFVVDCSGSMKGMFGRVREELTGLVESLEQDQFFYIIFFGADKLTEFGQGGFVRASKKTRNEAVLFIESIVPSGSTNTLTAFERALQITDGSGTQSDVIYFLTDGFELAGVEKQDIVESISELLIKKGSRCGVNTIGFWPSDDDRKILQMIAQSGGGDAFFIYDMTD